MTPPVLRRKTLSEQQREKVILVIKEMLKKDYVKLSLNELSIKENIVENNTEIVCKLSYGREKLTVNGSGKGPVDALFTALANNWSGEYCSLKNLHFTRFAIEADIEKHLRSSKADATVVATLEVDNNCAPLLFRESANSINVVSAKVVLSAIEHFINAEKCVTMLYRNIQSTKKRNRGDMTNIYTQQLAEIVKNVSYENVISKLKETN